MNDLHDIQRQIVAMIDVRPIGSSSRFRLMDAADAVSKAMAAIALESGAQTADFDPDTTLKPNAGGPEAAAPNSASTNL